MTTPPKKTKCLLCGQDATEDQMSIKINPDEQVSLHLNLYDVFGHIQKLEEEKEELIKLLKELAFKNQNKE